MKIEVDLWTYVGGVIAARRKCLHLKQEKVAKAVGISRPSLVNMEQGRQAISLDKLYKFADILNCKVKDLIL